MTVPAILGPEFTRTFAHAPHGFTFAPGRVNLIGEHVDYNGGLVLPMPIAEGTWIAWSPRSDRRIEVCALDFDRETVGFTLGDGRTDSPKHWLSYVRGMAESCAARGLAVGGANLAILGTVPRGAGLSSSASLCVGIGRALAAAAGHAHVDQRELAFAAQATEHAYAGVRCGIMDQMVVALGIGGQALLLDCRDLTSRAIVLPSEWAVVIVQSGVSRGLVEGHYNARRRDCEAAVDALGIEFLREATPSMIAASRLDAVIARRALHVVNEIERTADAAAAIERCDLARIGSLLRESHASLRDLFEVSVPQVDALVEALNTAIGPCGGARMTGGGFGGAVVAVVARSGIDGLLDGLRAHFGRSEIDLLYA